MWARWAAVGGQGRGQGGSGGTPGTETLGLRVQELILGGRRGKEGAGGSRKGQERVAVGTGGGRSGRREQGQWGEAGEHEGPQPHGGCGRSPPPPAGSMSVPRIPHPNSGPPPRRAEPGEPVGGTRAPGLGGTRQKVPLCWGAQASSGAWLEPLSLLWGPWLLRPSSQAPGLLSPTYAFQIFSRQIAVDLATAVTFYRWGSWGSEPRDLIWG